MFNALAKCRYGNAARGAVQGCSSIMRSPCLTPLRLGGGLHAEAVEVENSTMNFQGCRATEGDSAAVRSGRSYSFSTCMRWRVVTLRFAHAFGIWVKAMQFQPAHVENDVGQRALTICLSTMSGMDCKHDRCGAVLFDFFWVGELLL